MVGGGAGLVVTPSTPYTCDEEVTQPLFSPSCGEGFFSETGLPVYGGIGNLALSYVAQCVVRDR